MRSKSLLLFTFMACTAQAATFRVGTDAACTHSSLSTAITAAEASADPASSILLASNGIYTNTHQTLDADKSLTIRGGYSSCSAVFNSNLRVTVSGAGSAGSVFTVDLSGATATANVTFDTLLIRDGNNFLGGGINVRSGAVRLINSEVRNNVGNLGAGISVALGSNKANPGGLRIERSFINNNTGATLGGGIYCDDVEIKITSADIVENQADTGGGIYLTNFCSVDMVGTGPLYLRNNQATNEGGGAYLNGGASVLNTQNARVFIDGNRAQFGGAMYVDGLGMPTPTPTRVALSYAWIRGNTATVAAVSVQGNARFELRGGPAFVRCENGDYCTRISDHTGGAISVFGASASLLLDAVAIQNNTSSVATQGAVLDASGNTGTLEIRNSLITGNQGARLVTLELPNTVPDVLINASTLVANPITGSAFARTGSHPSRVNLGHSIIFHSVPVNASAAATISALPGTCLPLVNENTSIGGPSIARVAATTGLDANFFPNATGNATDACPVAAGAVDLNQRTRSVDLPFSNLLGPQDQGAQERQFELFRDGFE